MILQMKLPVWTVEREIWESGVDGTKKKENSMGLFKKKVVVQFYDKENKKPVIKSSICNGIILICNDKAVNF